jgi:hypothetical protein
MVIADERALEGTSVHPLPVGLVTNLNNEAHYSPNTIGLGWPVKGAGEI